MARTLAPKFWNKRAAGVITDWVTVNPLANWNLVNANSTLQLLPVGAEPEGYVPGGGRCVKGSNTNHPTNAFAYSCTLSSAIDMVEEASFIEFPVYYDSDYISPATAGLRFDFGSGGNLTNEYQKTFTPSVHNARMGWNIFSYPLQCLIGGTPNATSGLTKVLSPNVNAMNFVRLLLSNGSNPNARDVYIGPITYRRKSRPTITLSFDDGLLTQYQNVEPLLTARGWKGTIFIITSRPTDLPLSDLSGPYMNWNHIAYLAGVRGWDVQCHSNTHVNQYLGGLTEGEFFSETVGAMNTLRSRGYSPTYYAWPGGGYTERSKFYARQAGVNLAFSLGNDFDRVPWAWGSGDYGDVRRLGTDNGNVAVCLQYLAEAIREGCNAHFYTHDVGAAANGPTYTNVTDFTTFLDALKSYERQGLCDVNTISEYVRNGTGVRAIG